MPSYALPASIAGDPDVLYLDCDGMAPTCGNCGHFAWILICCETCTFAKALCQALFQAFWLIGKTLKNDEIVEVIFHCRLNWGDYYRDPELASFSWREGERSARPLQHMQTLGDSSSNQHSADFKDVQNDNVGIWPDMAICHSEIMNHDRLCTASFRTKGKDMYTDTKAEQTRGGWGHIGIHAKFRFGKFEASQCVLCVQRLRMTTVAVFTSSLQPKIIEDYSGSVFF